MNIVICLFVADFKENENNKKNKIIDLKLVVDNDCNLIKEKYSFNADIKVEARNKIKSIIGSETNDIFHLEQVYTFGEEKYYKYEKAVDVIFVALINSEYISKMKKNYKMIDIAINNNKLFLASDSYDFKTIKNVTVNNIEYIHDVNTADDLIEKKCIQIITCYKYIRIRSKYTDILFKLLPQKFTLEEARILYQNILDTELDKANFRKKIIKYCTETNEVQTSVGYRPTKLYKFHVDENDVWI